MAETRNDLPVKAYAHLPRCSCGYFLANKGWLEAREVVNGVRVFDLSD